MHIKKIMNRTSPAQVITCVFFTIVVMGTLLLKLPISDNQNHSTSWIDALFVATSAVCVTGLTPIAIHEQFNVFGQSVILILIEIGGIGFMSIPVFFYFIGRKRVNFRTRLLLRQSMNLETKSGEFALALAILKISFFIQLVGTIFLSFQFVPKYGVEKGIWYGFFHAISAFCNAGFDLFGNSMSSFQHNPWVLFTISFLIISGGLGFIVWTDILNIKQKKISLQSKLALVTTGILLVAGSLFFVPMVKSGKSLSDVIAQAFFLATTPRTAGFFTVDYGKMSQAGLMMTMILMFIGGTSGSTAGGLKTTTFSVLLIKVHCMFKGKKRVEAFGRTLKEEAVSRAMILFFISLSICTMSIFLLSIIETGEQMNLVSLTFEVISAFGTVGLTTGITPSLSVLGKLIIITLMFIGRVGILTILFSLGNKHYNQGVNIKYPEEVVMLG